MVGYRIVQTYDKDGNKKKHRILKPRKSKFVAALIDTLAATFFDFPHCDHTIVWSYDKLSTTHVEYAPPTISFFDELEK